MAILTFFVTKNGQFRREQVSKIPKMLIFMKTENFKDHADEIPNDSEISGHMTWSSYPIFQYKASKFRSKISISILQISVKKIAIFERTFSVVLYFYSLKHVRSS